MGYTTYFNGGFYFNKEVDEKLKEYIDKYSYTRHMSYDTSLIKEKIPFWRAFTLNGDLGKNGALIADKQRLLDDFHGEFVKDYNDNGVCPGLWSHWVIEDNQLVWDEGEKFYNYIEWLEFYITHFFEPYDLVLNGVAYFYGEERGDCGYIIIDENHISSYYAEDIEFEELLENFKHNPELYNTIKTDNVRPLSFDSHYEPEYGDYEDYEEEL